MLNGKSRVWERDRRERLKLSFNNLSSLLPKYDPASTLSKAEILQKATNYIRELQQENDNLLHGSLDEFASKEVQQLKQQIEELVKRVQQLVKLLQDAGISIPPYLAVDSSRPLRWSNKFNQEDGPILLEKAKRKKAEQKNAKMEIKKKKKLSRVLMIKKSAAGPLKTVINSSPKVIPMKQTLNTSNIPSSPTKKSTVCKKSKDKIKPGKPETKLFGDKLPTVAQLLGLTMNDIDTTPAGHVDSATISVHETSSVASSTLINTSAPLPPGFIVIQGSNGAQQTSLSSTSVVNHHQTQPCVVMPTSSQAMTAKKIKRTSMVSQPMSLVLSNSTSSNVGVNKRKQNSVVAVTKSHLLTAPVIASGIQTCPPPAVITNHNTGLAGFGPGTLILANGNIVPVLPPPQTLLTATPTRFIVNSNHLPPPANPTPVIMMQQQKNAVTVTTSSNGAALIATSCSKPQQRLFPVLVPKVSKKPGTSDTTVTTFANKVPIPALTSRHQPVKRQQIQAPVANIMTKSPGKYKNKNDNENIKPANAGLLVCASDKVINSGTKKTALCKVKERLTKIVSANENSRQRSLDGSNDKAIVTDMNVNSSRMKKGNGLQKRTETAEEFSEKVKDKDKNDETKRVLISDAATRNDKSNCKQDGYCTSGNVEKQIEGSLEKETRLLDINENLAAAKRKQECEEEANEEIHNKKKRVTYDMKSNDSNNADMETNNAATVLCPALLDSTSPSALTTHKSCKSGTYTIDVLCMTKPIKCPNITKISEESKCLEKSVVLTDTVCSEDTIIASEGNVKDSSLQEQDTVQLTGKGNSEISEAFREQVASEDNPRPFVRSESQLTVKNPLLISTSTVSDICQHEEVSNETDKCNSLTNSDLSVSQQVYDTHSSVDTSQLLQVMEINKLPQSPQSLNTVEVTNSEDNCHLTIKKQQNCLIKCNYSVSLQNNENVENEGSKSLLQKSIELPSSSSWQEGKGDVEKSKNSSKYSSLRVDHASHAERELSSSILPQHHHEIDIRNTKAHDTCNGNSVETCPSVVDQEKKSVMDQTEPNEIYLDKSLTLLQSNSLYPTFTTTGLTSHCNENTFIPITSTSTDVDNGPKTTDNASLNISLQNSEFSSDLFASLQVPSSGQHPESISPTAAFLLAFPLVSSSKVAEMIVDSQEEVGSDSMQGGSTLLQIGNIEHDPSQHISKPHRLDDINEIAGTSEAAATRIQQKITTVSSPGTISDRDNGRAISAGCNVHDQQQTVVCRNHERKTEESNQESQNSGKCSSSITLHLQNFSKSSGKQWSNVSEGNVLESGDKLHSRSRSIGTQSKAFSNLERKISEANCSQNSLPSTIKTCSSIDAGVYNIQLDEEKGSTHTTCFQQQMETGNLAVSTNNIPQHPILSSHSHITIFKSGQQHQECHPSSDLFQPSLSTFEPVTQKNASNGDNTKRLTVSTNTFSSSVSQHIEELCMKPQTSFTSQHNGTCANMNLKQTFLTNKETNHTCENLLSHAQPSGSTVTNHIENQNSFHKMHPSQMISEQGTMTEGLRDNDGSVSYKPLTSSTSVASSAEVIKHNLSSHTAKNSAPTSSHVDKCVSYNNIQSSVPAQPCSYNLFNNDYSAVPSQVTCTAVFTQASNSSDQNKMTGAASFSVAHNSSNFSILSWTTLSPMTAPSNINQHENFNVPPQGTSTNIPLHTPTAATSLQKVISQNTSSNNGITMPIPTVSEMQGLVHNNNCQKQCKNDMDVRKSMNDEMHKLTESFPNLYNNEEQQSLGMPHRDTATSHIQFHRENNENQILGRQEEDANNENFKFPGPSAADIKNHQPTRTNHSTERMKVSQQHRPPVNWMTTPDIRTSSHAMTSASSSATIIGHPTISNASNTSTSVMNSETSSAQINKEFEFCSTTSNHNLFIGNSNATAPTFDGRSFVGNAALYGNHVLSSNRNLYTNNRQSSHLSCHKEETRNVHHNPTHQRLMDLPVPGENYRNEAYSLSWTPRKVPFTSASMIPPDMSGNNFVPSTLPTLVGDLALGTNYPMSGNDDSSHNKAYIHSNFGDEEINKKNVVVGTLEDRRQEMSVRHIPSRHTEKESGISTGNVSNKTRNSNQICTEDYLGTAHSEGVSSEGTAVVSGNFLSVSQLVDPVKSGAGSSRTQVNATARRSSNSRHVGGGNKHNTPQTRQHAASSSSNKRNSTTHNSIERDSNKKQQLTNMSFSAAEGTNVMPISEDSSGKANDGNRPSHYSTENATTHMPPISQGSTGFSIPVHDMGNQRPSSIANAHHHWSPNRGKPGRTGTASYKAPVSSYSAEALIGLSSSTLNNEDTAHLSQESANNKIITLPPPLVSERFCHNQNYHHHHHQAARSLQMSTSFSNEAIVAGNYFPPVELPPSHQQDGSGSSIQTSSHHDNFTQTHQNQQPYSNTSFSYPAATANMSGQGPASLYPPANFVSNSNGGHTNASIPPVSLPTGFLSDLTGSNTFTGAIIPPDSNNPLIFPSPIMKSVSVNRNSSGRHNPSYLQASTSVSSHHHQTGQQMPTRHDNSIGQVAEISRSGSTNMTSNDGDGNRRLGDHAGGLTLHHQTNNLVCNSNSTCSLTKQRGNGSRRRIPDPVASTSSSSSGITGLVDLGYLPMPPGIGSPMLGADDGAFLSHHTSGTFLAPPGPQLYPTGPTPNPQGTLYPPTPHPPTQTTSQTNHHSGSHLPPFSSCAPTQQNVSLSRASHHNQQQQQANTSPNATNTSGNTLANFNLSTIFPEINDKQVPSIPSVVGYASGTKNLTPASSSLLPSSNGSQHHSTLLQPGSSDAEYPHRVVPPPATVPSNCLPPPPVPLHTNFNNLLSHAPPQVCRMQWP
ncbi:uncharacterized protein LOC110828541 isoform X2 [Zootermopsis nevadensis]|uniref:uncharacterized protein LOC110828541 isoform X2 n=1 Tax=Zootermopsis nevadensis TaxID=136037 RepID=UPI000B8E40BE|nr:uncharacterized protein LOC110828541 isoform X2 [Zootermopsis nevadensis]